jgi:hypothetical protein
LEESQQEANKYSSKYEFYRENSAVWQAAYKRSDYNKICSHMKKPKISAPEKAILEEVSKYFPTAKKFRETKIRIPGKEFIKGLEIDIFVPELNKGIEFDGEWYHSLDGLKRGHPKWPIEALREYHTIKDDYFYAKGIQILHIKEEDWIKDKKDCLNLCISFLYS